MWMRDERDERRDEIQYERYNLVLIMIETGLKRTVTKIFHVTTITVVTFYTLTVFAVVDLYFRYYSFESVFCLYCRHRHETAYFILLFFTFVFKT
jgi:hypothetical protein